MQLLDALLIITPLVIAFVTGLVTLSNTTITRRNKLKKKETDKEREQAEFNYSFIPEKPIVGDIENPLKFGHDEIVDTLENIVKNSPKENSLTIGLYGSWGSGKSTITTSLMAKLANGKIPLVIFDVWKHEGDALRRTFLNHLVSVLRDKGIKNNNKDKGITFCRINLI